MHIFKSNANEKFAKKTKAYMDTFVVTFEMIEHSSAAVWELVCSFEDDGSNVTAKQINALSEDDKIIYESETNWITYKRALRACNKYPHI